MKLFVTRDIARPADEVFEFVADSSNNPRWQKGQKTCEWTSAPPTEVGSTYEQEARFMGRTIRNRFEVIEYDPGRVITMRSDVGTFPIQVRRRVDPLGPESTRVTAEISGEPAGLFRLAGPLLQRLAQRSVDADYDRLKRLLEEK